MQPATPAVRAVGPFIVLRALPSLVTIRAVTTTDPVDAIDLWQRAMIMREHLHARPSSARRPGPPNARVRRGVGVVHGHQEYEARAHCACRDGDERAAGIKQEHGAEQRVGRASGDGVQASVASGERRVSDEDTKHDCGKAGAQHAARVPGDRWRRRRACAPARPRVAGH